jgi:hypothetical protein
VRIFLITFVTSTVVGYRPLAVRISPQNLARSRASHHYRSSCCLRDRGPVGTIPRLCSRQFEAVSLGLGLMSCGLRCKTALISSRPIQRGSSRKLTMAAQKPSLVVEVVITFSSFQVP